MSKKGKRRRSVIKEKKALKAILFGDSFTKEFRPITLEKPRILLPVVNIPMINYILEMLVCSGVKEIFIFCKENHEMIDQYIAQSKWRIEDEIVILTKYVKDAKNIGDFLRNVEDFGVRINSDFLVLYGDIISNINLDPIVRLHQEMRKKDSLLLMTSVYLQESSFAERRRYVENDKHSVCIAYGKKHGGAVPQLITYKNQYHDDLEIDVSKISSYEEIEIRSDLIDCHIDICCPDVIEVFKENFDYKDMRNDLVKGVLTDQVISVGNTIMPYIVPSKKGYCRRVSSLRAYESISSDIVRRWMYPIVPESNFTGLTSYLLLRGNNYMESGVVLDKHARVRNDCVIGSGCVVGTGTEIECSIIGRNVRIGENVKINNSYIWDNAIIEDGCKITSSLMMDCIIRKNSTIERGCLICSEVTIGEGQTVGPFVSITTRKDDVGPEHESGAAEDLRQGKAPTNVKDVGEGGTGRMYSGSMSRRPYNVFGCNVEEIWPLRKKWVANVGVMNVLTSHHHQDSSMIITNEGGGVDVVEDIIPGMTSPIKGTSVPFEEVEGEDEQGEYMYFYDSDDYGSEFGGDDDEGEQGTVFVNKEDREKMSFYSDVREIVQRSVEKEHGEEKVYFELRSRQFAYDRTMREAAIAVLRGLIFYCFEQCEEVEEDIQEEEEEEDEGEEESDDDDDKEENKEEEGKQSKWLKIFENCLEHGEGVGVNWKKFLLKYVQKEKQSFFEKEVLDSLLDLVQESEDGGGKFEDYLENLISILFDAGILNDHAILDWSMDVLGMEHEDHHHHNTKSPGADDDDDGKKNEESSSSEDEKKAVINVSHHHLDKEYSEKDQELVRKCRGLFEWLKSTEEDEDEESLDEEGDDDEEGDEEVLANKKEGGEKSGEDSSSSSGLEDDDDDAIESDEESELEDEDEDEEDTIESEESD